MQIIDIRSEYLKPFNCMQIIDMRSKYLKPRIVKITIVYKWLFFKTENHIITSKSLALRIFDTI